MYAPVHILGISQKYAGNVCACFFLQELNTGRSSLLATNECV